MMKNKKNVSKKKSVKTRKRKQLPYFEINPDGTILEFDGKKKNKYELGGDLSNALGGKSGSEEEPDGLNQAIGSTASFVGNTAGELLGADDDLSQVEDVNKGNKIAGSALKAAGSGAMAGSAFGPLGTAAGALIGGTVGLFKGKKEADAQLDQLALKNKQIGDRVDKSSLNTFVGAYGGELPEFAMGGSLAGTEMEMGGEATEYNGNKHSEGGIALGSNAEVEDGEVRVGDYVFSDQLETPSGKTFAAEAKKITRSFEEYENDGPSMRTQDKMLKELQHGNDQARLLKQKEDAQIDQMMAEGALAYGGMISTDKKGKAVVAKENRMAIREAAKDSGMSYNEYVNGIMAYGGKLSKKKNVYAEGGPLSEAEAKAEEDALLAPFDLRPAPYNFGEDIPVLNTRNSSRELPNLITDPSLDATTNPLKGMNAGKANSYIDALLGKQNNSVNSLPTMGSQDGTINNLSTKDLQTLQAEQNLRREPVNVNSLSTKDASAVDQNIGTRDIIDDGRGMSINDYLQGITPESEEEEKTFGSDEAALLAAQLPNAGNFISSLRSNPTKFDRVELDRVSMQEERDAISKAIDNAKRQNRRNVRGTATSAGDALAAMSAGNAGLTDRESDALTQSFAREENTNSGISNQEKMTNVNISNQEMIANQQDQAMRQTVRSAASSAMGENTQGYLSDKKKEQKNLEANRRIMDLLNTGEYKMTQGADGTLKIEYIDPKI